jgi:hypothetical protein
MRPCLAVLFAAKPGWRRYGPAGAEDYPARAITMIVPFLASCAIGHLPDIAFEKETATWSSSCPIAATAP